MSPQAHWNKPTQQPASGRYPPPPLPPQPRKNDGSFEVVNRGTYVYPVQYGSIRGTIQARWGYGLFPWQFTAALTADVETSAILSWDPSRASWVAYPLAQCPTETWFTLSDNAGDPLPAQFYLTVTERGPKLRAVWS
jgi:hypothetical protein